jgi:hypothetical protein
MDERKEKREAIIKLLQSAMTLVDEFQPSRPAHKVFDHIEDAILWTNVLCDLIPLKPKENAQEVTEKKDENVAA